MRTVEIGPDGREDSGLVIAARSLPAAGGVVCCAAAADPKSSSVNHTATVPKPVLTFTSRSQEEKPLIKVDTETAAVKVNLGERR
jgi:hypothetical protein